ncbi:MAG: hypothetical protein ACD_3C00086G0011 [uncultured bacterium (gcode 4)]|uniref:Uncharacterized protein n=1 Tax=uncultured bacterium (gcode 4) TaxID=1234023 RepID=K2G1T1_9BACT|nr:MAG: hypothetical protein ACD_3C00086G0011 [uncultured bacterium (gcode 4)]
MFKLKIHLHKNVWGKSKKWTKNLIMKRDWRWYIVIKNRA